MVDSPISFLSQKLEKLPINDYLFISRSLTSTSNNDFNFTENGKVGWREHRFYGSEESDDCQRLCSSTSDKNNVHKHNEEDSVVKTAEFKVDTKTDEIRKSNQGTYPKAIPRTFKMTEMKPTTMTTAIKKSCKFVNKSSSSFSPTFSKSLPTTSSSTKVTDNDNSRVKTQLRRSPSKRKHSEVMEATTNLLSYNYEETSSFTRSCDFEVFDICKRDFRNIQRALSFDDDLLRSNLTSENNQKHNGGENPIKMASSSYSPLTTPRHQRQHKPTCKSQPTFSRMGSSFEKPRKFKIISPSDELSDKAFFKHFKVVGTNDPLEPQPPLKSVGS